MTATRGIGPGATLALVVLGATTALARSGRVHPIERRTFRAGNDLPDELLPPVYVLMQSGSLAAVYAAAGWERWLGRRRNAAVTVAAGSATWVGAKLIKRWVRRGRPWSHVSPVHVRGTEAGGLGFPSGHAAVAFCLASLLGSDVARPLRPVMWGMASAVGFARIYVGAHLPLDVAGGAALGLVAGRCACAIRQRPSSAAGSTGGWTGGSWCGN